MGNIFDSKPLPFTSDKFLFFIFKSPEPGQDSILDHAIRSVLRMYIRVAAVIDIRELKHTVITGAQEGFSYRSGHSCVHR